MVKRHLKRLKAPKKWPIEKKEIKWIAKPLSGPHPIKECIPLNILVKDLLKYAKTTREVKKILYAKKILIDNKPRKDYKFPIGIMDIITIPETKEHFILIINKKGKFTLAPIKREEANLKLCKIIGKKVLNKNKIQLNLYGSRNYLTDKNDYKVGDTLVLDLLNKKIKAHIKLEKNTMVFLIGGKHIGNLAIVEDIPQKVASKKNKIIIKLNNKKLETSKDYVFVIGKEKPIISLPKND